MKMEIMMKNDVICETGRRSQGGLEEAG